MPLHKEQGQRTRLLSEEGSAAVCRSPEAGKAFATAQAQAPAPQGGWADKLKNLKGISLAHSWQLAATGFRHVTARWPGIMRSCSLQQNRDTPVFFLSNMAML